jgi:hypothetical protein
MTNEQMRLRRRGTDGLSTHAWKEADSNRRFRKDAADGSRPVGRLFLARPF